MQSRGLITVVFCGVLLSLAPPPVLGQDRPYEMKVTSRPYDMRQLVAPPVLSAQGLKGRTLWAQRCAYCHDGFGSAVSPNSLGRWIDAEVLRALGDSRVRQVVQTGTRRMPGFQYALQANQVDLVLDYLKTVSPDQKPKGAR